MDSIKIGKLIFSLRTERQLTQQQLAESLNISDKTVSKWERGIGCPDVSLLPKLSSFFGISLENFLSGELVTNDIVGGNMKKLKFYICPSCGNLLTSTSEAAISCCGKKLMESVPQKVSDVDKIPVEKIENEYYVAIDHEMTKAHYITFVAFLTGDSVIIRKQYPEWNVQTRIPCLGHGMLIWHCNIHGLYYQLV